MLDILIYICAGVLIDILHSLWNIYIVEYNVRGAMLMSFLVTVVSYTILYYLILSPEAIILILAYAAGGAVGSGLTIWYKKKRSKNLTQ